MDNHNYYRLNEYRITCGACEGRGMRYPLVQGIPVPTICKRCNGTGYIVIENKQNTPAKEERDG
jgi:DnaJ-class molecular chaperone